MITTHVVAHHIVHLVPLLMRKFSRELRFHSAGVDPSHFRLLSMLSQRAYTLSELAEHSGVSPATMSRTVATLVDRGWVDRQPDPADRRLVRVVITAHGCEIARQVSANLVREIEALLGDLPAEDLQKVENGVAILLKTLSNAYHRKDENERTRTGACEHADQPVLEV
jgi:DNA-binding MarR family transcriptional regulator